MKDCVVAIDIGASNGRLIACFLEGGALRSRKIHRFENDFADDEGDLIWDVGRLYDNICHGLTHRDGLSIKSVGVDTWGVDYVLVDERGRLLDKPFAYRDPRTDAVYEKVMADVGKREIYDITGIQFMPLNTLYQLKAHIQKNPDVFSNTKYILMMPDYLHYRLCGVFCNEFTEATTTQMINHRTKLFDEKLLAYLGIPVALFPPMVRAGDTLGALNEQTRQITGLGGDVRVIAPGSHDTASAIASFVGDSTTAYVSSGTWSLMGVETESPVVSDMAMRCDLSNEGGVYGTNTLLKNIMGMWIINRVKQEIAADESFDVIAKRARMAVPFRTIINPNAKDFLNPASMVEAIRNYAATTKQNAPKTIGAFARCIYESLALSYRKTLIELEAVTGRQYANINIIGGGSRNGFVNQITADITRRHVIAGPIETSSIGNAVLQMISLGWIENLPRAREIIAKSEDLVYYQPQDAPAVAAENAIRRFNTYSDGVFRQRLGAKILKDYLRRCVAHNRPIGYAE